MWVAKAMRMGRDLNVSRQDYADGLRPKCESPRLRGWVTKACKLPHLKEKDLRTQDFKSEEPFLRKHCDFKTKIKKSKSDSK